MEKKKSRVKLMSIICFGLSLVLIALYFMPLWTYPDKISNSYRKLYTAAYADSDALQKYFSDGEFDRPSLFFLTKTNLLIGAEVNKATENTSLSGVGTNAVVLGVGIGIIYAIPFISGILIALFSLLKLPGLMLFLETNGAAWFLAYGWSLARLIVKGGSCPAGIAYWVYFPCFAALAVCTILLKIFKKSYKKALRKERELQSQQPVQKEVV